MKKLNVLFTSLLCLILFFGCNENKQEQIYDISIEYKKANYLIKDKDDLFHYAQNVIGKDGAIIKEAEFIKSKDDVGIYYAIDIIYDFEEERSKRILVGLEEASLKNNGKQDFLMGCIQECKAEFCEDCKMKVHEICRHISCDCLTPLGPQSTCSPSITIK